MTQSLRIFTCKEPGCGKDFPFSEAARARAVRAGLSAPERCPLCRSLHSREIGKLGVSHVDIPQVRETGTGGLGYYARSRQPPRALPTTGLGLDKDRFPVEEIIDEAFESACNCKSFPCTHESTCTASGLVASVPI